ncbi:MAG TPA: PQQ-dependent sugar dehydrogenase [Stellaceae bacterium]|nr:PQQ-dependent sugar dehydrogenase [Stellaceae bacterium]
MRRRWIEEAGLGVALLAGGALGLGGAARAAEPIYQGQQAFGGYPRDAPGVWHKITPADLPPPFAPEAPPSPPHEPRAQGTAPQVLPGFSLSVFATGLREPRQMKRAPNGDIFLSESGADRIRVLRAPQGAAKAASDEIFAEVPAQPYGIAFYPPGPNPQYLYVASAGEVVRIPYRVGDTKTRGRAETVIRNLPDSGHWTRDILFTPEGKHMLVAVGSNSNISTGAAERFRANILEYSIDGTDRRVYASGLRNPVTIAFDPVNDALWASVNERDRMGDNLPPDYVTHVEEGKFYGWPYFYIGNHRDPRVSGTPPVPGDQVVLPDVLIQPHSAPLGMAFYTGTQFPAEYRNDLFVALHGSWNRNEPTGYKVIRVQMQDGRSTGAYEDFMTGFLSANGGVRGRPVGVVVAADGSLLVSDDGSGTVWRIAYSGGREGR